MDADARPRTTPRLKESAENLAVGKAKLRSLAALQLTWPGMASIYYGTEVGLTGSRRPGRSAAVPVGRARRRPPRLVPDAGTAPRDHVALREGDLQFVHADDAPARSRSCGGPTTEAAVTVLNLSAQPQTVEVDVTGRLPEGAGLTDGLGGPGATVTDGTVTLEVPAQGSAVLLTAPGTDLAPPAAPTGLTAEASAGQVALAWQPPAGEAAATYEVHRSLVRGGGYERVGTTAEPSFVDDTARNGTRYHYVVVAVDAAGNPGARSGEAEALPMLAIADARLEEPADARPAAVRGRSRRPDRGTGRGRRRDRGAGPTVGILAELGFGPAPVGDPETDYEWTAMAFDCGRGRRGPARRDACGRMRRARGMSCSACRPDGGSTWVYADRSGIVPDPWAYRADGAVTIAATPAVEPGSATGARRSAR